jgi:hypothetical protein
MIRHHNGGTPFACRMCGPDMVWLSREANHNQNERPIMPRAGIGFEPMTFGVMSLTHLSAVDALRAFPNDPLLGVRATILLRIDWRSGLIGALLW